MPVEFLRESDNGCLTLVVDRETAPSKVMWSELIVSSLDDAIESLRQREGGTKKSWIGRWPSNGQFEFADIVEQWARPRHFDGVVWAALPPKRNGQNGARPNQQEAIEYLRSLVKEERRAAEEYVRKAPSQIDTPYRRAIVEKFGWNDRRNSRPLN